MNIKKGKKDGSRLSLWCMNNWFKFFNGLFFFISSFPRIIETFLFFKIIMIVSLVDEEHLVNIYKPTIEVYVSYLKKVGEIIRGKKWLIFLRVSDQEIQTFRQLNHRILATFPQRRSLKM